MEKNNEIKEMTIGNFFDSIGKSLIIPIYSRSYKEDIDQVYRMCKKFIEIRKNALGSSCENFKKCVLEITIAKYKNAYALVDGQQRLISLLILLNNIKREKVNIPIFDRDMIIVEENANSNLYIKRQDFLNLREEHYNKQDKVLYTELQRFKSVYCFIENSDFKQTFKKEHDNNAWWLSDFILNKLTIKVTEAFENIADIIKEICVNWEYHEKYLLELKIKAAQCIQNDLFYTFCSYLDNQYLDIFFEFSKEFRINNIYIKNLTVEEVLQKFIEFCFHMMWLEDGNGIEKYNEKNLDWINGDHLNRLFDILYYMYNHKNLICNSKALRCINYSFGNSEKYIRKDKKVADVTGQYWKLTDNNYHGMLKEMLYNILQGNKPEIDILLWCFLTNVNQKFNWQEYLRTIKILLNNNRVINTKAYYSDNNTEGYDDYVKRNIKWFRHERIVWYTRYSVYGIPNYYNIFYDKDNNKRKIYNIASAFNSTHENIKFISEVLMLNKKVSLYNKFDLQPKKLLEFIKDSKSQFYFIDDIIIKEVNKQGKSDYLWGIRAIENLSYINGLINGLSESTIKLLDLIREDDDSNTNHIEQSMFKLYEFISHYDIDLNELAYNRIQISPSNRAKETKDVFIFPQTLCDFFTDFITNQPINKFEKDNLDIKSIFLYTLKYLPISWLSVDERTSEIYITFYKDNEKKYKMELTKNTDGISKIYYNSFVANAKDIEMLPHSILQLSKNENFRKYFKM